MRLLLMDDCSDRSMRLGVERSELLKLNGQVPQDDTFDCDRGGRDGRATEKPRDQAQNESPETAKVVTAATADSVARQVLAKAGAMTFLVTLKLPEHGYQVRCREAADKCLSAIDVHRAVLTGVIDLDQAPRQRIHGPPQRIAWQALYKELGHRRGIRHADVVPSRILVEEELDAATVA